MAAADAGAIIDVLRRTAAFLLATLLLLFASLPQAQGTAPAIPLTLVTREGRRPIATTVISGQEVIALDELGPIFQITTREDALTGGLTISYKNRTIVVSPDRPMASVNGRVVTLPSAVVRSGRRWLVPVEFLPRALGPIYDQKIDLRRTSRLLIVGDLRIPRVTARIDAVGPPTTATIEVAPPAPINTTVEAGRVVVRIDADALDLGLPVMGGGLIEQIRAGDQPNTVVVALGPSAGMARATPTTADPAVTRVTIDVSAAGAPSQESGNTPRPAPASPAPPPIAAPRPAMQTIAIDPGHGGEDVGARGPGGLAEKDVTLEIARRLRALIETRLGIRVVETREDDRAVTIDQRAAIANNNKAELFISLHANAAWSPKPAGAEVYHLRADRELDAVRREAESSAVAFPVLGGGTRTVDVIRWDLAQARHVEASAMFASILGTTLTGRVPMAMHPVQEASLRVLEGADMPAALIEVAYLTNPSQEKLAGSEAFKDTVAQAIFDSIMMFRATHGESRPQ